ncbi:LuxR family transcriptional regulator [Pseudomonas brassicacearum]|uniref:LuxR family transcriptional regulator n=1 Tax=Pseudomonas brassicacearum TaxID=930166 RepID=UPI002160D84C|nr:LuxR family transcriptional regulator [Pseudomonas brassicacearum]UVM45659.1 LuxR family transcriptional regulator [Pseudomonas brassicacearum]
MVDMKKQSTIAIWEGCDATISEAIEQFGDRWSGYSTASKRYPITRLVEELIDPAVAAYAKEIPARYQGHIPGAGTGVAFSAIMKLVGFPAMIRLQRQLLRAFVLTHDQQSKKDRCFIATLETLIELVMACKRKKPSSKDVGGLNNQRLKGFCRFCGSQAELASFATGEGQRDPDEHLRLSNLYCTTHRPKTHDGSWNPAYRQAKRAVAQFDLELARLSRQCAIRAEPKAKSGDELVDAYIFRYMLSRTLHLADEAELRNLARLMVDVKLTDRRKQILVLQKFGFNQSEIARRLEIERQAVSKALRSIPDCFRLSKA